MSLLYKPDWEETKDRFRTWWAGEYFGRCAISVTAPRSEPPPLCKPRTPNTPEEKWFALDLIAAWNEYRLSQTFFGGEAFPTWSAGYAGVSAIPTFLGCHITVDMNTGWWDPILTNPDVLNYPSLRVDEAHPHYRFTMTMLHRAAEEAEGKSIPSIGAFGGSGDTLAAVRGTEQLLLDCVERPDEVKAAEEHLMDMWCAFYDRCYSILHNAAEGSTCWFNLWSPGKFYAAQNDFSYNIGPKMFCDIFLPVIDRQTRFLDHSVYHVDGVQAFAHVDALCELPHLQALQILPGAGKPSPLYYMDVLRKVQKAGKNLHITIPPDEVETALENLSARGLFISTSCTCESEARQLLKNVKKWSSEKQP